MDDPDDRLPAGRTPWDVFNGLRVGALAGGLLGATVPIVFGASWAWVVVVGAAVGGATGYLSQRRSRRTVDHQSRSRS